MTKVSKQTMITLSSLLVVGLMYFGMADKQDQLISKTIVPKQYHQAVPLEKDFYEIAYSFPQKEFLIEAGSAVVGIVSHHLLAADMIASFYSNLATDAYDTIILLGPNHFSAGEAELISSLYDWETPYGVLECDQDLLSKIKNEKMQIGIEPKVIARDHAITSQVAFIKKTFPEAKFLPFLLHPNFKIEQAEALAKAIMTAKENGKILLIASVDFAHYMDSASAIEYDKASIVALRSKAFSQVYQLEVDSPPTLFTVMKYAEASGADFQLLDNSNSALLAGKTALQEVTSYVTGYFVKAVSGK